MMVSLDGIALFRSKPRPFLDPPPLERDWGRNAIYWSVWTYEVARLTMKGLIRNVVYIVCLLYFRLIHTLIMTHCLPNPIAVLAYTLNIVLIIPHLHVKWLSFGTGVLSLRVALLNAQEWEESRAVICLY